MSRAGFGLGGAARFAFREMRGGIAGFRVFLLCLTLGVAAVAAVGAVRAAIEAGLSADGRAILGGDAEITLTYRRAEAAERAWMTEVSTGVSEVSDFRSMVRVEDPATGETEVGLTQVKGVDGAYPLAGSVVLAPEMTLAAALAVRDGLPGIVMAPLLIDRLGLNVGDRVALGTGTFVLRAALVAEPDRASGGFGLGPRSLVSAAALAETGLLAPGTLYETRYRLALPPGADLDVLKAALTETFPEGGTRWRDRRAAAPGVTRFVERIGGFLVLVGLAALAVGGLGVAMAIRSYLDERTKTIATLKSLGATGGEIFRIYLIQIGALAGIGTAAGVLIGSALPLALGPLLTADLPVPAAFGLYAAPVWEAALYGLLTAAVFALWPLARARETPAAALYRDRVAPDRAWPAWRYLLVLGLLVAVLAGAVVGLSAAPVFAAWFAGGLVLALAVLRVIARVIAGLAGWAARSRLARGRPGLRMALANLAGPGGDTMGTVLSLGLGLTVLAAIGQVDHNLQRAIGEDLPADGPAFFFVDIQGAQHGDFVGLLAERPAVSRVETAPMLRGIVTRLDGVPAAEAEIDPDGAWILRGDRGVSYAAQPPPGTEVLAGAWWPEDYSGPPLVSFSAEHAAELGLEIGDSLTVNVLGREITAEVANLRRVEFRDMGINFLMIFDPGSFAGAPHTYIATLHAEPAAEGAILRDVSKAFPNVTAIAVRDAAELVTDALGRIAGAARWAAGVTLITGLVVLIGAAAAAERRRTYEAAVLKVLGATRRRILGGYALQALIIGGLVGLAAVVLGALAAWGVVRFVLEADFGFAPWPALVPVIGGALVSLIAGLGFAWRALARVPARVLRERE